MAMLSHVYTVLRKDWGWHELINPVQLVRRPSVADARDRRLFERIRFPGQPQTRDELGWLMHFTDSPELPIILMLAVETAMRRSEIALMQREWLNLQAGTVWLPTTKNGTARTVPLTPIAHEILRRFVAGRPLRGRIFSLAPSAITRAFIRARRRCRAAYETAARQHGRRASRAYFKDLRFHDLRHEATSRLAEVYEPHKLAKITGHRDMRMLMRYYHPRGRTLVSQLRKSALGRRQLAMLRDGQVELPVIGCIAPAA
jgi:integrase